MPPLTLHPDRFFDPDPAVRSVARALYTQTASLPLVCPHGHVPPALLAEDRPFPEPASLLITPDHYLVRMLYAHGVPMEALGQDADARADPRAIWQQLADHYHLFLGTPSRAWLDYVLHEVFGVREKLTGASAGAIYDAVSDCLDRPAFRPRALYASAGIEVLATTDAATDDLRHHAALRDSGWGGRVIPTFRPDALFHIAHADWPDTMDRLRACTGSDIGDFAAFVRALADRRSFFRSMGAVATDHGVESPRTLALDVADAERLFRRAIGGMATSKDQAEFEAHMLMIMAGLSVDDGLVMQLHAGALRNHNRPVFERFGPDRGGDIPVQTEFTRNLRPLLNAFGNDPRLTLVLFTLDESTYTRELAPLAGHYPAVRLGPPWWFLDSIEGMRRYRRAVTETAGVFNTAGFNDDTRAFLSIPARHDLARRLDAEYVAELVVRHQVDEEDAERLVHAMAVGLVRETYRLDAPPLNAQKPATTDEVTPR